MVDCWCFRQDKDVIYLIFALAITIAVVVSWYDLKTQRIPTGLIQIAVVIVFLLQALQGKSWNALIAIGIGFVCLLIPSVVSRGRMLGKGDAWIGACMGAVLGWPLLGVGLCLSAFFGGIVAIILLAYGWKRTDPVPFAPMLFGGMLVALFWGERLSHWLMQRFL